MLIGSRVLALMLMATLVIASKPIAAKIEVSLMSDVISLDSVGKMFLSACGIITFVSVLNDEYPST